MAFVVECGKELIAVGRYDRLEDRRAAEVAFVVADAYQHHGLAPMLLYRLATAARSVGITRFVAEVLAENKAMLSVFRGAGFPIESNFDWGTVTLTMTTARTSGCREWLDRHAPEKPCPVLTRRDLEVFHPISRLDFAS